jgi:hypothetical protein
MIDFYAIIGWIVLAFLFLGAAAAIVYIGSLPGRIAQRRNHPQVDAVRAASWIGLALMGIGWPIAFVWAFLRHAPAGSPPESESALNSADDVRDEIARLTQRLSAVEEKLATPRKTDEA